MPDNLYSILACRAEACVRHPTTIPNICLYCRGLKLHGSRRVSFGRVMSLHALKARLSCATHGALPLPPLLAAAAWARVRGGRGDGAS